MTYVVTSGNNFIESDDQLLLMERYFEKTDTGRIVRTVKHREAILSTFISMTDDIQKMSAQIFLQIPYKTKPGHSVREHILYQVAFRGTNFMSPPDWMMS
jgi:hypothetical protein